MVHSKSGKFLKDALLNYWKCSPTKKPRHFKAFLKIKILKSYSYIIYWERDDHYDSVGVKVRIGQNFDNLYIYINIL